MNTGISNLLKGIRTWALSKFYTKDVYDDDQEAIIRRFVVDETAIEKKVDAVDGKGLSTNDYTTAEKTKLAGIAEGAQANVIESIKLNGTALSVSGKSVDIASTTLAGWGITDAKIADGVITLGTNTIKPATLGDDGKVPAAQLPSYVDDVVELLTVAATAPTSFKKGDQYFNTTDNLVYTATSASNWGTGASAETSKIYVALDTNKTYRWSGSALVEISQSVIVVDNLSSTSSSDALSANQGRALDEKKVDKEEGKGLSTNDFTNDEKSVVDSLKDITVDEVVNELNSED